MIYCNTKDILDKALSKVQDSSADLRSKALGWLNEVMRDVLNQPRDWKFLHAVTASVTITSNTITLPDTAAEIVYMKVGDYMFTMDDQLTEEEAFAYEDDTSTDPEGWTRIGAVVTFLPGATGTCELKYEATLTAEYTDSTSNTIFPNVFKNLLMTGVRMHYYDYDKDGRYGKEVALYQREMDMVKAWDNRLKPMPKISNHGYTRI